MQIQWMLKRFDELTPYQLYAILQLRNEVFVVEQACVFQDADDKDQKCYHLMGFNENKLVAYTRLAPARLIYEQPSIGRVITAASVRRKGVGIALMQQSIDNVFELFGKKDIKIGAQLYLKDFYSSFGFEQASDVYLEDGIEHIYMIKKTAS
ncbi:MAG TPA: GNAT family N-acetyltransferase [Chitinophagaceae bacterium]|nr:GNAT family N-acetyltransferase [Chitinophagaceae bacterium]